MKCSVARSRIFQPAPKFVALALRTLTSALALGVAALLPAGCTFWGNSGTPIITSATSGLTLSPALPTRIYDFTDSNTADFYLTDLPPETWTSGGDVSRATGVLMHVHMFLASKAGSTPIASGATIVNTRIIVLAGGAMGVYGGGGFLLRSGEAGDDDFGGRLPHSTLRLLRATPGFVDRLGPSELDGYFEATLDATQTEQMRRAFDTLISKTAPVATAEEKPDEAAK
ncbi:MAG: hypothetical protein WC718_05120 [Phycisphaerales bacterium]|jgi:hypothetical protein